MAYRIYVEKNRIRPAHLEVIRRADEVLAAANADGFTMSVRQLYYHFVANDLFSEDRFFRWTGSKYVPSTREAGGTVNADPNYKWLGGLLTDGRMNGLIDWDFLEDRHRGLRDWHHDSSPAAAIRLAARRFALSRWEDQPYRVEVWVEKDALAGVVERACSAVDTPFLACKGYMSVSEIKAASERFGSYIEAGQKVIVIYLGDHDPSGLNMDKVNERQIREMMEVDAFEDDWQVPDFDAWDEEHFEFRRIALSRDQVRQFNAPPNPAKMTDSRAAAYVALHGPLSWELDAIPIADLVRLIQSEVEAMRDLPAWGDTEDREAVGQSLMNTTSDRWSDVVDFLS